MATFGYFSSPVWREWPCIVAMFSHHASRFKTLIEFVIDTGACNTFISPLTQVRVPVSEKYYTAYRTGVVTIHGLVRYDCLTGCSLHFFSDGGDVYTVSGLNIFFAGKKTRRVLRKTSAKMPDLLGRDVLEKLALAYCRDPDRLFLTDLKQDFVNILDGQFPHP